MKHVDELRFTCRIAGVPEDTFAVGDFTLQEQLSELFTLNLTLVRAGNATPFKPQAEIDLASLLMQEAVLQVFYGETDVAPLPMVEFPAKPPCALLAQQEEE
ncbi:hypothetical protein [Xenorhabdus sp. BG5]|uniref:hypothetical protein n=1 Tax=Xenorhabdus sp. BG5 TaxID=2782014 RepID=UPI0018820184|nr:hypothetical protein [Xenorhabdus sp. BG5]